MSNPNAIFGIHSITPYSLATGLPLSKAPFAVIGTFNTAMTQELIEQIGGSSFDPQDIEQGVRTIEGAMLIKDMPSALIEIATGQKPTENAAEPGGSVTTLRNVLNASVQDGVTGIASVAVKAGSEADLANIKFTVVAVSPTTVDVFAYSDVDFAIGSKTFQAGSHKITVSPLTITTAAVTTEIPGFGVDLVGGSGAIAMVVDDTAVFSSRPINTFSRTVLIGDPLVKAKKVGLYAEAQRKSDGSMFSINVHSALVGGLTGLGFTEKVFQEGDYAFKASIATNIFTGLKGLLTVDQVISSADC